MTHPAIPRLPVQDFLNFGLHFPTSISVRLTHCPLLTSQTPNFPNPCRPLSATPFSRRCHRTHPLSKPVPACADFPNERRRLPKRTPRTSLTHAWASARPAPLPQPAPATARVPPRVHFPNHTAHFSRACAASSPRRPRCTPAPPAPPPPSPPATHARPTLHTLPVHFAAALSRPASSLPPLLSCAAPPCPVPLRRCASPHTRPTPCHTAAAPRRPSSATPAACRLHLRRATLVPSRPTLHPLRAPVSVLACVPLRVDTAMSHPHGYIGTAPSARTRTDRSPAAPPAPAAAPAPPPSRLAAVPSLRIW
ncbi:hypothetical protein DFH08DRAFT_1000525 [Mycena albidolilacea]|uniref:Uncharacterized protein n=1 Tax=Mycena albidolilacea TaxID=1033008 RepID=A0AAD7A3G6_9AGAR|nr:hypothetical protein DFH08DRAFT_1000525 [Mycena albidolilacea]